MKLVWCYLMPPHPAPGHAHSCVLGHSNTLQMAVRAVWLSATPDFRLQDHIKAWHIWCRRGFTHIVKDGTVYKQEVYDTRSPWMQYITRSTNRFFVTCIFSFVTLNWNSSGKNKWQDKRTKNKQKENKKTDKKLNQLASWRKELTEKLTVVRLVKKSTPFAKLRVYCRTNNSHPLSHYDL